MFQTKAFSIFLVKHFEKLVQEINEEWHILNATHVFVAKSVFYPD